MDLEPIRTGSEIFVQNYFKKSAKPQVFLGHDPAQRSEHTAVSAQTDKYYN